MDIEQLVSQIVQHTGISPDLARKGVQLIGGFLKGKLPPNLGSQIDAAVGGQTISTPQLAEATTPDQIAGAVSQDTGIPEGAAKAILQMAASFLADKIPAPFGDQIKGFLGVSGGPAGVLEQAKGMLGGILGH